MNPPHIIFSAVPDELKILARWVAWRSIVRDGKPTKVPVDAKNGQPASCSDPNTWATYADALARFNSGTVNGIGLQVDAPHVGIDLDGCRNPVTGVITSWAQKLIKRLGSYSEISPSGNGIHIWVKGTLPAHGRKRGPVEMYCSGRFLTVTGIHVAGTPTTVEERQAELTDLHVKVFGKADPSHGTATGVSTNPLPDDELIRRARNAENGEKFSRLWSGDYTGYASQSEADLALCVILAFWAGRDSVRIDRLFRQSKLFRPKWDQRDSAGGRTYGQLTVEKATAGTGDVWNQPSTATNGNNRGNVNARPSIVYSNRQLDDITREALEVLRVGNSPPELFVRSGQIVRIRVDEDNRPIIETVGEPELRARLASVSDAVRVGGSSGTLVNCFPNIGVVKNLLALGGWPLPALQAIVEAPVLRPDGTVLRTPGYDAKTRLFYAPTLGFDIPEIPDEPCRLDIAAALDLIDEIIGDFPFVDEASKANAIAMILTPVVRPAIQGKTPLALIDAPQMGTGKSLLSEVVSVVATGREAAMMSAPKEEDEWRKRITAALSCGASTVVIDNVEHPLESAALASVLTATNWTDRILGATRMITLPVRTTWIASGNNIKVGGDIARRCYLIRLDAKTARPWKRTGFKHAKLSSWVFDNREEILAGLLTLARAWFANGKPVFEVPPVGGFDGLGQVVGGALGFAGVSGFLKNLDGLYDTTDEASLQWELFLGVLASTFKDEPFMVKQVVEHVQGDQEIQRGTARRHRFCRRQGR